MKTYMGLTVSRCGKVLTILSRLDKNTQMTICTFETSISKSAQFRDISTRTSPWLSTLPEARTVPQHNP